jgi:hypothetical protein
MSKYYKTSDLGLAAYLLYKGVKVLGTAETSNPRRHAILFEDQDDRESFEEEYRNDGQVSAIAYSSCAHKIAKELKNPVRRDI